MLHPENEGLHCYFMNFLYSFHALFRLIERKIKILVTNRVKTSVTISNLCIFGKSFNL